MPPIPPSLRVVHSTAVIEWLEGERFLIHRARTHHPDSPDSISIVGITGRDRVDNPWNSGPTLATDSRLCLHYFDVRGVFRVYDVSIDDAAWRLWRDAPGSRNGSSASSPTVARPSTAAGSYVRTT